MPLIVRDATSADMAAVCAIHNAEGIASTASWDLTAFDEQHWLDWLAAQQAAGRACLVAELDQAVVGYASWGPFRGKCGWAPTIEHSVYLAASAQGRGIGRRLLTELMARACSAGAHTMVGVVDADNLASQQFHAALGFELLGVLPEAGRKFDRWLDAAFWIISLR